MAKADNITYLTEWASSVDGGGSGGDNGAMEARVAKLEAIAEKTGEQLRALDKDLGIIKSNYATKEDVATARGEMKAAIAEAKNSIIMWVVSAILLAQLLPALLKRIGI